MFKVGDKVRRKAEFRDPSEWDQGDRTLTVKEVHPASNSVYFEEIGSVWGISKFEPADPEKNRVAEGGPFKVGDKVRRLKLYQDDINGWSRGDQVLTVLSIDDKANALSLVGTGTDMNWYAPYFELVESAPVGKNRVVEAMVSAKVGPFKVRVWVSVDPATPLTEVRAVGVTQLLAEVDDNYRDPDIGHDDTIVRLQDLLEKREDVAAYEITGTDGCGVVVYPDWR